MLVVAAMAGLAWVAGCGDGATEPPPPDPPRPATVTVTPATAELAALGATVQLRAEVRDQNGQVMTGATVTWASGSADMATVNPTGLVTAAANGTATITASAGGASGEAVVTVMQSPDSVAVLPAEATIGALGDTLRLAAEAFDANGRSVAGAEFSWEVSDDAVALVDGSGLVTAAGNGTATITASAGGASGTAVVTVMQSPDSVGVLPAEATIGALGDTLRLAAEAFDANGRAVAGAEFSWESSDDAVAAVDGSGLVTAAGNGTATITAASGSASGNATVTVAVGPRVTLDSGAGSAPEDGVVTLGLTVDPVPESVISVRYTLGVDRDPATADADGSDYTDGGGGAVEVAARASSAVIEIAIDDDDEIESVREVFTLTLDTPGGDAGYGLGVVATAAVTIEEGVCDRTAQVGDEIVRQAGVGHCSEVEDRHLASIQELDLCLPKYEWMECEHADDLITDLREGDFLGLSGLAALSLGGNDLTALPEGVFSGLSNLGWLDLQGNALTELPAGVFAGLSNLWHIGLGGNGLTELPAGIFSGLSRLNSLDLYGNDLTELPAGVFAGLSNLWHIGLGGNELTALPPGVFAGLASLEELHLDGNELTALPPGIFAGLTSLGRLGLGYNPGSPFTVTAEVTRTDSDDSMSPGPATLEFRVAEGAPFAMTIPLSARGGTLSTPSASFAAGATVGTGAILTPDGSGAVSVAFGTVPTVCEDHESNTEGPKCSGLDIVAGSHLVVANPRIVALSVPAAHLTQATQDLSGSVPLIAGRQALLRVFGTADEYYVLGHEGQATFFVRGQEMYRTSLETPASGIPLDVDEGRLAHSFNARIPGHVLQPGLEMVVELDPDGLLSLKPGSRSRFPVSRRLAFDVQEAPPMNLTIVPVLYDTEANRSTNPEVEEVTRDLASTDSDGVLRYTRGILPIGDLNVKLREPYYTSVDLTGGGTFQIMAEIEMLRHLEAGRNEYYHGIYALPNTERSRSEPDPLCDHFRSGCWPYGAARRPGFSAVSRVGSPTAIAHTLAHELGHNLSLPHAPCGDPDYFPVGLDPDFPYADGSIGVWGHRFTRGDDAGFGQLFGPEGYKDVMSYCSPIWISDYNFTKALNHQRAITSPPALFAQRATAQETLLLWGGIQEGELRLKPAFAHDARLKLPEASGPYQLAGLDAEGRRLFSLSFTPDELDHGGSSFLFAIPFEPEWTEDLDRITLTGPEGSTTLDRDTGGRAALIIDRASGRVRTISRDWSDGDGALPAAMAANIQVEIIRGLPSR